MLIDNKNLFPLKFVEENLLDYWMDADGEVYSTKRGGKLTRLSGSIPYRSGFGRYSSTGTRTYTLNGKSYPAGLLRERAMAYVSFSIETYDATKKTPGGYGPKVLSAKALGVDLTKVKGPIAPLQNRSHAASVDEGVAAKGWIICSHLPDVGLVFSKTPAIHLTTESAKAEMERLAREVPGTKFVLLRILNTIVSGGVTWQ